MKKICTTTVFILSIALASGQKVQITWGEESKTEMIYNSFVKGLDNSMVKLSFTTVKTGGFFSSSTTLTPVLVRYTDKLTEAALKSFTVDQKNVNFNNLLSVKKRLYMFTSIYDKDSKSTSFYAQPVDINSLTPIGQPINLGSFDAINKSSTTTVGYSLSKDSSKILMFGEAPYSKKENQKYYIGVYDSDMKKLWEQTVELPYQDKYVDIIDHLVTNEGKVGVIIKHYDQEVKKEAISEDGEKVPAYKTKFLFYDKAEPKPVEYILNFNDKFVHKLKVTDDNAGTLTLFGLYKSKYNGYVSGFFVASIDKETKKVTTTKQSPFPPELMDQLKIDKQGTNKEKDPGLGTQFTLAQTIDRADGSKDYLLEYTSEIYVPSTSYYNASTHSNTTTQAYWKYNYGNIIDVSLKPNGSTVIARIPKMQSSINVRMYSNFKALAYKDKLAIFFNDDPKNIERDINKKPEEVDKFTKSVLAMAVIDSKGELTRSVIQENRDVKEIPAIRESTLLDNTKIGLYAHKSAGFFTAGKDMVGILELK